MVKFGHIEVGREVLLRSSVRGGECIGEVNERGGRTPCMLYERYRLIRMRCARTRIGCGDEMKRTRQSLRSLVS